MSRLWDTAAIHAEVARRKETLLDGLAGSGTVALVDADAAPPNSGPVDHVVSVAWLAHQDDLDAAVGRLSALLGEAGRLHLIEPTCGADLTARAQRWAATVAQRRTGWRIDRDIPAAARRAGLVLTDLERFSMPVPSPVLRPWIQGTARVRPDVSAPGEGRP
jgi:hypothetical protein